MNCTVCKLNKICRKFLPDEGFLCYSGHMQCNDCNERYMARCGVCGAQTTCIVLTPRPHLQNVASARANLPPPAEGKDHSAVQRPSCYSASLFEGPSDLSVLQNISLSVNDSRKGVNPSAECSALGSPRKSVQINNSNSCASNYTAVHPIHGLTDLTKCRVFPKDSNAHNGASEMSRRATGQLQQDGLKHYLQTYEPLAAYNFNGQGPSQMQTIAVSTESAPSLNSFQPDTTATDVGLHRKFGQQDYVVMNSTAIDNRRINVIKPINEHEMPGLDVAWQKLLNTYQEVANVSKLTGEVNPADTTDKKLKDSKSEPNATSQEIILKGLQKEQKVCFDVPNSNSKLSARHLHIYRAIFRPMLCRVPFFRNFLRIPIDRAGLEDPPVQFEKIIMPLAESPNIMSAKPDSPQSIAEAFKLMSALPFHCPESRCAIMIFIADFQRHFKSYHGNLPKERITVAQCKNLVIDPGFHYNGNNNCHYLYYLRDNITTGPHQYFLPLVVMSSCVSITRECDKPPLRCLVIWVTGFIPEGRPIYVTLAVWPRTSRSPPCRMVYSGEIYSIRKSQAAMDVFKSGQMLLITPKEARKLTNKYREMISIQVVAEIGEKPQQCLK